MYRRCAPRDAAAPGRRRGHDVRDAVRPRHGDALARWVHGRRRLELRIEVAQLPHVVRDRHGVDLLETELTVGVEQPRIHLQSRRVDPGRPRRHRDVHPHRPDTSVLDHHGAALDGLTRQRVYRRPPNRIRTAAHLRLRTNTHADAERPYDRQHPIDYVMLHRNSSLLPLPSTPPWSASSTPSVVTFGRSRPFWLKASFSSLMRRCRSLSSARSK